jgi:flagellar motor switch protein FliG
LSEELLGLSVELGEESGEDVEISLVRRIIMGGAGDIRKVQDRLSPEAAEALMTGVFLFEDILELADQSIQKVLREVDVSTLVVALSGASEEIRNRIFRNMNKRSSTLLKEDMEYLGPVRDEDIKDAQQNIVNIIYKLSEQGEIRL